MPSVRVKAKSDMPSSDEGVDTGFTVSIPAMEILQSTIRHMPGVAEPTAMAGFRFGLTAVISTKYGSIEISIFHKSSGLRMVGDIVACATSKDWFDTTTCYYLSNLADPDSIGKAKFGILTLYNRLANNGVQGN